MAYFDWNATAPLLPEARETWLDASERFWANPSTPYRLGVQARLALDEARERVAACLAVQPDQVVFTSGATEGNNGLLREAARRSGGSGEVWISSVEHPSVRESARRYWGENGVRRLPVLSSGELDVDYVRMALRESCPALVCLMAVNNETGVIQPVELVQQLCRNRGIPFFCDAVQWTGKHLGPDGLCGICDAVVTSGHKFGAPKGCGFVILGPEWRGLHIQSGGAQELDSRAGTENLPAILAMVRALEIRLETEIPAGRRQAKEDFERALKALWPGEVVIHGESVPRVWNTCLVGLPAHGSARWISRLDRLGYQVSSGSACSSGKDGPSAVLQAMGVEEELARRTLRISSGWETRTGDWEGLLEAFRDVRAQLDSSDAAPGPGQVIDI